MPVSERLFNTVFGANFLLWAALGIGTAPPDERWTSVRICVTLLNVAVGCLFLLRRPLRTGGSLWACMQALPSFLVGGVAFRLAPALNAWSLYAQVMFDTGTIVTLLSLWFLGRSFAIFPAQRDVVSHGVYRIVRHPMYLGELTLIAAIFIAGPSWLRLLPLVAALPLVMIRILAEERLLGDEPAYRQYRNKVRWRLVPGLW